MAVAGTAAPVADDGVEDDASASSDTDSVSVRETQPATAADKGGVAATACPDTSGGEDMHERLLQMTMTASKDWPRVRGSAPLLRSMKEHCKDAKPLFHRQVGPRADIFSRTSTRARSRRWHLRWTLR